VLLAIAAITVASGLGQIVAPQLVLRIVGADTAPAAAHFFAIIGMFMALFGGLLWQALRAPVPILPALFWASLQKLGAAAAVAIGVRRGLFGSVALLIAAFDLGSGVLALWYWQRVRRAR
jgi:hypothetical protein